MKSDFRGGQSQNTGNGTPPASVQAFLDNPPNIRPIKVALLPVPLMVADLIPEPFREWLADIARRASCPLDLPAISAIISTATVVGRKVGIRPKRQDEWLVVPNLWGAGVLPPGWLKTHCLEEAKKPLMRLEAEARDDYQQELAEFEVEKLIAETKAAAAATELKEASKKKGKAPASEAELKRLAAEALAKPSLDKPTLRRLIVNDTTVERLGELLAENRRGLLQYRDELVGFLRMLEKQGHENDRAFYLESWNGDKSYCYDRIGRGHIFIPSTTVSILGGIQPGRLSAYIRETASGVNDDGLISRFQLMVYPDVNQPFVNVDRWPNTDAKNRAYQVFKDLDTIDPTNLGAFLDGVEADEIPYLRFTSEAQDFFDGWRTDLENRIRSSQESAGLTSHWAKFRSLMPSLALLFHLIEVVDRQASGPVSLDAAQRAAAWCDFLEAHAKRIYQAAFDGDPEPAQRLGDRLRSSLPNPFSVWQVVQKGWSGLDTTEAVERAVAMLEDHDWVRRVEIQPGPQGGRPKVEIHVNPLLLRDKP
jgi:putative DNA primase/helicase